MSFDIENTQFAADHVRAISFMIVQEPQLAQRACGGLLKLFAGTFKRAVEGIPAELVNQTDMGNLAEALDRAPPHYYNVSQNLAAARMVVNSGWGAKTVKNLAPIIV